VVPQYTKHFEMYSPEAMEKHSETEDMQIAKVKHLSTNLVHVVKAEMINMLEILQYQSILFPPSFSISWLLEWYCVRL